MGCRLDVRALSMARFQQMKQFGAVQGDHVSDLRPPRTAAMRACPGSTYGTQRERFGSLPSVPA
jgi:hypothetical protein